MAQHVMLTNHLPLMLRPALPEDAEQVLAYLEQVAGESENLTFGPGEYGFVREGRRTREFYLHGQFVDVFLMGLQLDPTGLAFQKVQSPRDFSLVVHGLRV